MCLCPLGLWRTRSLLPMRQPADQLARASPHASTHQAPPSPCSAMHPPGGFKSLVKPADYEALMRSKFKGVPEDWIPKVAEQVAAAQPNPAGKRVRVSHMYGEWAAAAAQEPLAVQVARAVFTNLHRDIVANPAPFGSLQPCLLNSFCPSLASPCRPQRCAAGRRGARGDARVRAGGQQRPGVLHGAQQGDGGGARGHGGQGEASAEAQACTLGYSSTTAGTGSTGALVPRYISPAWHKNAYLAPR